MEFFTHPWYMVAGGVLVSAPILIHLINRMRFKRVRWAAMEFLLKSQKRNRRRLIIEQMILLALRCLLVLLFGFLAARFIGAGGPDASGTTHLVILDDTPSMADHWVEKGPTRTAFEAAKEQIELLARNAAQAASHQEMLVFVLSDLDNPIFRNRLGDRSLEELHTSLASRKPGSIHVDPLVAIDKGQKFFNDVAQGQKILHLVSDFRDGDWAAGPGVEDLNRAVDRLTESGVHLSLIDAAHPYRSAARQVALHHDNLAIVDLRCESHVVAEGLDVDFVVVMENFGSESKKTFLKVKVDGQEDYRATRPIDGIAPGKRHEEKFTLTLAKKKPGAETRPGDSREERERKRRLDQEFVHIQASIEAEETGLQADNVRDLVVDVRRKVPTLVVDGSGPEGKQPGGDYFHLETAFESARFAEIDRCTVDDLDRVQLDLYPSLIFLNVPEIKSDRTLQKVRDYVQAGGSIAFFLGEKARPAFYNDTLFKKYAGLFPLLIAPTPYNAIDPGGNLSDEERQERRKDRRQNDPQPKILFKDPEHPLVATLVPYGSAFRYLGIDVYHRALPRYQWEGATAAAGKAVEVMLLPNNHAIDDYKERAQELGRQALQQTRDLAGAEPEYARFVEPVERYKRDITAALATPYLFNLVKVLDGLLKDRGPDNDPQRPDMATLWAHPRMLGLAEQLNSFREAVLYGDPLVVTRTYGKGRVVAVLTSAGTASRWNDWGSGSPASFSYEVFLMDLQRWLTGQGEDLNRQVGRGIKLELDAARYLPKVKRRFQPQPDPDLEAKDRATPPAEEAEQPLPMTGNTLTFDLHDAQRPGVYFLEFYPNAREGPSAGQTEMRAYAFNLDAEREGNLRRAARDKLERPRAGKDSRTGTVTIRAPGDNYDTFKMRQPDASESPWLYLLFLVVLVVEQALAVHLSFHLRGNEATPPAAVGRRPVRAPEPEPETAGV
jgi:hypothetical protein